MTAQVALDKLARQMCPALTDTLDFNRLTKANVTLEGVMPLSDFARLVAQLEDKGGDVHYRLAFTVDDSGQRVVHSHIEAKVQLICQRCLQSMGKKLEIDNDLALVNNQDQVKTVADRYEPLILSESDNTMISLIEDELLLALPFAPAHDSTECQLSSKWQPAPAQETEKEHPFASLADWQIKKQE